MSRRILVLAAITIGVLLVAMIGIRYAAAVAPSDYGLKEGDTVSAAGSDDPDVYIVNDWGYKRLFLNPAIFNLYGHLGGFAAVKSITPATRDAFPTSGLFRVDGTEKVYGIESTGEDVASLHWVNTTGAQAVADDPNFFKKVFVINQAEFNLYSVGSNYTSVSQVPSYARVPGTPAQTGPLSVSLAPDNPGARTITQNASGLEFLKVRFSGSGTLNTLTVKRLGPGETDDFTNVYIYDGARRLTSGKTFSSATGEATFLVNVAVSGTKDLSVVADMAGSVNEAGNVNYISLTAVGASGTVSGMPLNGNSFASSGTSSGRLDVAIVGSLANPTVGQKQAELSEFKLTANTEGASVKRLTMINDGSLKPSDLTNIKLTTGTSSWSGAAVTSDGYLVFDLGSGYTIAKGGNAIFKVYGDVSGKAAETVDLYFENAADLYAVGDQYGQGMSTDGSTANQGIADLDTAAEATTLTLQGGVLTLVFNGPVATNVGTQSTDVTLLRYSMTAATNIEIRRTELTLCGSSDGTTDTTFEDMVGANNDNINDIKVWNEDTNQVVIGPKDGIEFLTSDAVSCPDSAVGMQEEFTDVIDLTAGKTYNYKITADIDTELDTTFPEADDIVRIVLDNYGDDATTSGSVSIMKYAGTNTGVKSTDISPNADISGPNITITSSALTMGLAGTPGDQTYVKGTKDVDIIGLTFAASQASGLKVTDITLTGYVSEDIVTDDAYNEGVDDAGTDDGVADTGTSVGNAITNVRLYEGETGNLIAGSDKVSSNALSTNDNGEITFSNLAWNIPAGATKTLLVKVDLTTNNASGSEGDFYAFDIAATTDVTAIDDSSNSVTPTTVGKNGTTNPTNTLTVKGSGSMTLSQSPDSPVKAAAYWGQTDVPFSKFRLTSTNEGQYIERLTIAASVSGEATDAKANVKKVKLTYKNKAGATLTSEQLFTSGASANFGWTGDTRPYVPKDSNMDISVSADLRTSAEGATQDTGLAPVFFSLDLSDKYDGSFTNGFKAVGEGSGEVLNGDSTNIADVLGKNDKYVYRVFPKVDMISLASPYLLLGTPDVFKFTVTAMGLSDSKLLFDNQDTTNFASGSIKFEVVSSGEYVVGGSAYSTSFEVYDESNVEVDSGTLTAQDAKAAFNASLTFNFGADADDVGEDVEITGGQSKTFRIVITNPNTNYSKTSATGRAADYLQIILRDDEASLIKWVGNSTGSTADLDSASTNGYLRNLPANGPTFQR